MDDGQDEHGAERPGGQRVPLRGGSEVELQRDGIGQPTQLLLADLDSGLGRACGENLVDLIHGLGTEALGEDVDHLVGQAGRGGEGDRTGLGVGASGLDRTADPHVGEACARPRRLGQAVRDCQLDDAVLTSDHQMVRRKQ